MLNSGMAELVSILKYNPNDPKTALLLARFEEEGIPHVIKNEHAAFKRMGGSPELQVKSDNLERAIVLLKESGFSVPDEAEQNPFLKKFDVLSRKIPLLNKSSTGVRLLIFFILFAGIFTTVVYFQLRPTPEKIMEQNALWCVEKMVYKGKAIYPHTIQTLAIKFNGCSETIGFYDEGRIDLPGLNGPPSRGQWGIKNGDIIITVDDANKEVYAGTYHMKINSESEITLQSPETTIYLQAIHLGFTF
jgi:hypothetical protein